MKNKKKLDDITLDIEFLLISVIQGAALITLSASSVDIFNKLLIEYFPYVITGFIFILVFWSSALVHAISFIDWPFEMNHTFLYFLVSFFEIMTLSNIANPAGWFGFMSLFQIAAFFLYLYDLRMIKKRRIMMGRLRNGKEFYQSIIKQQKKELGIFLPVSLVMNLAAFFCIVFMPQIFISYHYHVLFISLQFLLSLLFLLNSIASYKKRVRLINSFISEKK